MAIVGGQEESKQGEEEKEEWSITFDEEEEELERPPSRERTRPQWLGLKLKQVLIPFIMAG